jgi:hypothetical protein
MKLHALFELGVTGQEICLVSKKKEDCSERIRKRFQTNITTWVSRKQPIGLYELDYVQVFQPESGPQERSKVLEEIAAKIKPIHVLRLDVGNEIYGFDMGNMSSKDVNTILEYCGRHSYKQYELEVNVRPKIEN